MSVGRVTGCGPHPSAMCIAKAQRLTCAGYRIRQFNQHLLKNMTLTHIYIFIDYISAMTFIIAAAIVHNGLGITTDAICKVAIRLCLLFYTAGKVSMYVEHTYS